MSRQQPLAHGLLMPQAPPKGAVNSKACRETTVRLLVGIDRHSLKEEYKNNNAADK